MEGYPGFQVTRMIEGFLGFEIFNSGIFVGRKIWQVFWDFWGLIFGPGLRLGFDF